MQNELRMYRWIHLPCTEVSDLEQELEISLSNGHKYTDLQTGIEMVELHVDSHPSFQERMNATTMFGGNLSVRMPPNTKPLIGFGQDECIFKQYLFTNKAWTTPEGQKPVIPKDEGLGVMISAFVSREFGFGMKLSDADLVQVNEKRQGKHYSDKLAAMEKRGTSLKQPLVGSPFVVEFEYGVNTEGYWTYDHMVLQMEDCSDVLNTLHPEFDFIFLFDHSCGHDRKRPDGLCCNSVRKEWGGKQPKMRETKIETNEYLGPFQHELTLPVGSIQRMHFLASDVGPYYLLAADKELKRTDRPTGTTIKRFRNKADLQKDLAATGVSAKGSKDELQALCKNKNVPIEEEIAGVEEGWVGKPKGMLQILWERGFIDPEKTNKADYTLSGKKDAYGNIILQTSLKHLMSLQIDFIEEETLLQYHGRLLGIKIERTPKCHPEIAGEGVEYDWGCSKGCYRRLPMSDKRSKNKFRESVRKCMDRDEVLTIARRRLFSKRAREYMLAYSILDNSDELGIAGDGVDEENKPHMTAYLIEKIVKQYKSHRSASDFDTGFINRTIEAMKNNHYLQ